ncbi:MAG: hypothetical protein IJN67_01110 [Oscillospiraceae bacterium]|nr:hypothetical protein [Oscillospiraceae bacterium]
MTIDKIIQQVAKKHHTTPEIVRKEMELAMAQAQKSTNPKVQALWAAIPHKGEQITLEEFIEYAAMIVSAIS